MNVITSLFHTFVSKPLGDLLLFLYHIIPIQDYGLAVIALTLLMRFLLYPLNTQSIKAQQKLSALQPKLKALQEKVTNKADQAKAMLELYRKEQVNPFGGILPLLIQLPVLIGLYRLFAAVPPESVRPLFFNIVDLRYPSLALAGLAGIIQFLQTKYSLPGSNTQKGISSQFLPAPMLYFFPAFTFLILTSLPSALALFWIVSSAFGIVQQWLVTRHS